MESVFLKLKLLFSFIIARLFGFKFIWAHSDKEKEMVERLRFKVYSDEGYIDANAYKGKQLSDKYDNSSDNLLVIWREKPVATVRVVHDSSFGFPTENIFNINWSRNRAKTIEISRLCILRDFRGKKSLVHARIVMGAIVTKLYWYSKESNIELWLFNMPEKLKRSFDSFGVPFHKIKEKEPLNYHLNEREIIKGYFKKRTLYPYFIEIDKV